MVFGARGQPDLAGIVVEAARVFEQAIEGPRIAFERLFPQHHEGTFLRRYLPRAPVLLHLDRDFEDALHVGREIAHAFAAAGGIARPPGAELGVLRGLAVPDLVAVAIAAG